MKGDPSKGDIYIWAPDMQPELQRRHVGKGGKETAVIRAMSHLQEAI